MIFYNAVEFENFLSFGSKQRFEFANTGMHYIDGFNCDNISDTIEETGKHSIGSGKCLHPDTEIEILIKDKQCMKDFLAFSQKP